MTDAINPADLAPSELLTAAADRIRDLAAAATQPPWEIEYDYTGTNPQALFRMDPEHPDDPDHSYSLGGMIYGEDNAWVAALSPAVAPALEGILREAARQAEIAAVVNGRGEQADRYIEARFGSVLALARAVLVPTEETHP